MVPEAVLEQTGEGLAPAGEGWFVVNAREAQWRRKPGRGHSLPFTGWSDDECEALFPELGVNLFVLGAGEPIGMYHWEIETEGFLVLAGEPMLLVEEQERRLKQWDYVHCPPHTDHIIVGAGDAPCVVLAIGTRHHMGRPDWGGYVASELASRYGCGVDEDTPDAGIAYARYPATQPTRYEDGWLPEL
jgi:uncharacterized cupin superfamily protein